MQGIFIAIILDSKYVYASSPRYILYTHAHVIGLALIHSDVIDVRQRRVELGAWEESIRFYEALIYNDVFKTK